METMILKKVPVSVTGKIFRSNRKTANKQSGQTDVNRDEKSFAELEMVGDYSTRNGVAFL